MAVVKAVVIPCLVLLFAAIYPAPRVTIEFLVGVPKDTLASATLFLIGNLEAAVKEILQGLDHYHLNDLPAFREVNPTAENLARFLYRELGRRLNSEMISVSRVKVSETKGVGAVYWEE